MAQEQQGYNLELIERKDKETNETSLSIISHIDVFNRLELLSDSDLKMILLAKKGCDTNSDNPYRLNDNCYHLGDNIFELRHVRDLTRGQIGKALSRTPNAVLIYSNVKVFGWINVILSGYCSDFFGTMSLGVFLEYPCLRVQQKSHDWSLV